VRQGPTDDPELAGVAGMVTPIVVDIMTALGDGDRHGYAIMQEVEERTNGAVSLAAGTLYKTLKKMLAAGLIVEAGERPAPDLDDGRRRYYHLTVLGLRVAQAELRRLQRQVAAMEKKPLLRLGWDNESWCDSFSHPVERRSTPPRAGEKGS